MNLYIVKRHGSGYVVLNSKLQWTPILDFAKAFEPRFADATATRLRAHTTNTLEAIRRG